MLFVDTMSFGTIDYRVISTKHKLTTHGNKCRLSSTVLVCIRKVDDSMLFSVNECMRHWNFTKEAFEYAHREMATTTANQWFSMSKIESSNIDDGIDDDNSVDNARYHVYCNRTPNS